MPDLPLDEQPDEMLFWEHVKEVIPQPHFSGKTAVVGHTPQGDGEMLIFEHLHVIDTYCYGDQWLTALDVNNGDFWQADNNAKLRRGNLEEA